MYRYVFILRSRRRARFHAELLRGHFRFTYAREARECLRCSFSFSAFAWRRYRYMSLRRLV